MSQRRSGTSHRVDTVVVGAGPAGTAVLAHAERAGVLPTLVQRGLLVLDSSDALGAGSLGAYEVVADTAKDVFDETLQPFLAAAPQLRSSAAMHSFQAWPAGRELPLPVAAAALATASRSLLDRVVSAGGSVHRRTRVARVSPGSDGAVLDAVEVDEDTGQHFARRVLAKRVVLATGGTPWIPPALHRAVRHGSPVHADRFLRDRTPIRSDERVRPRRVAIIGSSHSAFAAVLRLLAHPPGGDRPEIAVLHRRPPKITYACVADALADGADFGPEDVCGRTGRVFRFGGLRSSAARTARDVRDGQHAQVRLVQLPLDASAWQPLLDDADLVVAATGYRSSALQLVDPTASGWDQRCRLRDAAGRVVPGVLGLGLGTRARTATDGGEASFTGSVDGVWFYHHAVAPIVVRELLDV